MQHSIQRYFWISLISCLCLCAGANDYDWSGPNDYDFTSIPPSSDRRVPQVEVMLERDGYGLTKEAMRDILEKRKGSVFACLKYIEKSRMTALVPDVEKFYQSLEEQLSKNRMASEEKGLSTEENENGIGRSKGMTAGLETKMMSSIECLFTIDRSMSEEKKTHYLEVVRYVLFEREMPNGKNPPFGAYRALVSAWRYQDVDIKDDIVALIKSGRLTILNSNPICGLFHQYGDRLNEKEIKEMLEALKDRPDDRKRIIRQAHKLGMLLDQSVE